jgi:putative peptidoglycan lipid II flippase
MTLLHRVAGHPAIRSAAGFAGVTSLVKAMAFLKEAVVAAIFGVSGAMDAYLMALVVVGFPVQLFINALNPVFVREYLRIKSDHGPEAADAFVWSSAKLFTGVLAVVLIAWLIALPAVMRLVGHGLATSQRELVVYTVYGLTAYYFLAGLNLIGAAALQAQKRFALGGIIPAATPIVMMVAVLAAGADLRALVAALTAGTLLEVVLTFSRFSRPQDPADVTNLPTRQWARRLTAGTLSLLPGTAIGGLLPIIEQSIASNLGKGAIAALGYAAKLPATISSLLVTAVGVTVLPYFAEMLANEQIADCRRLYGRYVALAIIGGAAVSIVGILVSEQFVHLAFERGAFTPQDTATVSGIQQAYLLQIPGALVGMLSVRLIAARGAYLALTAANLAIVPVAGLLQWRLASHFGAAGIALGTSLGVTLSAAALATLAIWVTRGVSR